MSFLESLKERKQTPPKIQRVSKSSVESFAPQPWSSHGNVHVRQHRACPSRCAIQCPASEHSTSAVPPRGTKFDVTTATSDHDVFRLVLRRGQVARVPAHVVVFLTVVLVYSNHNRPFVSPSLRLCTFSTVQYSLLPPFRKPDLASHTRHCSLRLNCWACRHFCLNNSAFPSLVDSRRIVHTHVTSMRFQQPSLQKKNPRGRSSNSRNQSQWLRGLSLHHRRRRPCVISWCRIPTKYDWLV